MNNIICELCNKQFKSEYLLDRHKKSKIKCTVNKDEIKIKQLEINIKILELESLESTTTCKFCNDEYKNIYNLRRHLKEYCKIKHKLVYQCKLLLDKPENAYLNSNNADNIINNINSNNTVNNNNNNTNSVTYNIINSTNITTTTPTSQIPNLNYYGNENISHLTKQDFLNFTQNKFGGIIDMIQKIHCNKDHIENFNIYIEHPTSKYICVYNKNGWQDLPKTVFLEKLKSDKFNQLDDYIFSLNTDISNNETANETNKKYQNMFDEFRIVWYNSEDNKKESKEYLDKINCALSSIRKVVSKIKKRVTD